MSNEITTINNELITKEKIIEYVNAFLPSQNLKPAEVTQFVEIAIAFQLNPFKREIYCVAYGEGQYRQLSIVTGYEVYLKRADRINKLDGWDCVTIGEGKEMKAILTIYRKDWSRPFKHEAYYSECTQTKKDGSLNKFWQKMPKFMLKKVCIAQGFRLCFPDEFGGMPYTSDELPDDMTKIKDITETEQKLQELIPKKEEILNNQSENKLTQNIDNIVKEPNVKTELRQKNEQRFKDIYSELEKILEGDDKINADKVKKAIENNKISDEKLQNAINFYETEYESILFPPKQAEFETSEEIPELNFESSKEIDNKELPKGVI
jgi:phage recombination protein Bet